MLIYNNHLSGIADQNTIGIGVMVYPGLPPEPFQFHLGILYFHEYDDNSLRPHFCHLAGNMPTNLKDEPISFDKPSYWLFSTVTGRKCTTLGAFCRAICDVDINKGKIPYGFSFRDGLLSPNGKWQGEPGEGLTCATFVLSIFHALHINILDIESWYNKPEEDKFIDDKWMQVVCPGCDQQVQQRLYAGNVSPRFRPEEVLAGATNFPSYPLSYTEARRLGDEFIAIMKEILA
jgi:hypothetical protein